MGSEGLPRARALFPFTEAGVGLAGGLGLCVGLEDFASGLGDELSPLVPPMPKLKP